MRGLKRWLVITALTLVLVGISPSNVWQLSVRADSEEVQSTAETAEEPWDLILSTEETAEAPTESVPGTEETSEESSDPSGDVNDTFLYLRKIRTLVNRSSGVTVRWKQKSEDEIGYVFYKTELGDWQLAGETVKNYLCVKGLTSGETYSFMVQCGIEEPVDLTGKEFSQKQQETYFPSILYLGTPKFTEVEAVGKNMTLSWTKVAGANLYRVYYRLTGTEDWMLAAETSGETVILWSLKYNRQYDYTIQAVAQEEDGTEHTGDLQQTVVSYVLGVTYSPYTGVDYTQQTTSSARLKELNAARKMAMVTWTAPCDFASWYNANKTYSYAYATDGTKSRKYVKGKTYTGIPYSMKDRTYNLSKWKKLLKAGFTENDMSQRYYNRALPGTARGIDCSSFVYEAIYASGKASGVYRLGTYGMLTSSYYQKIDWYQLEPGDILLVPGHVMLYAGRTAEGGCAVFESCGTTSGVRYDVKDFKTLLKNGVRPYRFRYLEPSVTPEVPVYASPELSVTVKKQVAYLSWTGISFVNDYKIQYRINQGKWKTLTVKAGTTATMKLKKKKQYTFRVRCVSLDGRTALSGWSNIG